MKKRRPVNQFELSDIFRQYDRQYIKEYRLQPGQYKVMSCIKNCRTAALGGHREHCNNCGYEQNAYNSCRNRHCPKCQTLVKEKWLNNRKAELLPCSYFHNVFTLPHKLHPIMTYNKKFCLNILFSSVKETLQAFASDPQWRLEGTLGFISILHTWNQKLLEHFHLHCVIPGGVLSFNKKQWNPSKENFLFRTDSLAKEFKKRYLKKLQEEYDNKKLIFVGKTDSLNTPEVFKNLIKKVSEQQWIVFSKKPFAGPEQVLEYLGRYTHRVAISNNRIKNISDGNVTFSYRDRQDENKEKELCIPATEFINRFLKHVLPKGFMKIRYYGFLSPRNKKKIIPLLRSLIAPGVELPEKLEETTSEMFLRLTGSQINCCPKCKIGTMIDIGDLSEEWEDTS
ncbi:IS91 family transposase [bacterium]|nr:IS91 family transposase [bacterium]